jgi:lysophospholipase L1-like esterase
MIGMIQAARRFGASLWVGPTPVVEDMMPLSPFAGLSFNFSNADIARYNAAYGEQAAAAGIPYLDLYTPFSRDSRWEACLRASDGLHPNAEGYQMMAQQVGAWPAWRAMLAGK